jgi:hypothetical protein
MLTVFWSLLGFPVVQLLPKGPPYSPDLSPCDFWLFGFLKESMEGINLSTEDRIVEAITTIWRGVTFDTLQSVFPEWMQRFN